MSVAVILTLISTLTPFLRGLLGSNTTNLIAAIENAIGALWSAYKAGGSVTSELLAALSALKNVAQSVATDTNAPANEVALAQEIISIVSGATEGVAAAEAGADPAQLAIPEPIQ